MSRDEKVMMLLWRSALSTSITELLLLPKFDNSSLSVTRDKRSVTWLWANDITNYHLRRNTQWNPFNDVYLLSKFDVFSFSMTKDIIDFHTGYFAEFKQFKIYIYFANFAQVRIDPQLFYQVWVSSVAKNNSNSLSLIWGIKHWSNWKCCWQEKLTSLPRVWDIILCSPLFFWYKMWL